jgi:hypothetical protein
VQARADVARAGEEDDVKTAALTAQTRTAALAALEQSTTSGHELDVLVIGGGVTATSSGRR